MIKQKQPGLFYYQNFKFLMRPDIICYGTINMKYNENKISFEA